MYLIETIHIRSFCNADKQKAIDLFNRLPLKGCGIPEKIRLYRHGQMPCDLKICMFWKNDSTPLKISEFGRNLESELKYFGWISHTLWTPVKEKAPC